MDNSKTETRPDVLELIERCTEGHDSDLCEFTGCPHYPAHYCMEALLREAGEEIRRLRRGAGAL